MKKKMNEYKLCAILHLISTICFTISFMIKLIEENKFSVVFFGLSICYLCFTVSYYFKYRKENS